MNNRPSRCSSDTSWNTVPCNANESESEHEVRTVGITPFKTHLSLRIGSSDEVRGVHVVFALCLPPLQELHQHTALDDELCLNQRNHVDSRGVLKLLCRVGRHAELAAQPLVRYLTMYRRLEIIQ